MDGRFQPTSPVRVTGREEMHALSSSVIAALQRAGLSDLLDDLRHRVLDRAPAEVCESVEAGNDLHLSYKPMVELALHEIRDVARMPHLSAAHRRDRVAWALAMAGL